MFALTVENLLRRADPNGYVMPVNYPQFQGTWNMAVGGPGGGKTHWTTLLAAKAGIRWRLPILAQDITGNVRARFSGFQQQAISDIQRGENVQRANMVLETLDNSEVYTSKETAELLGRINQVIDIARRSKLSMWRGIVLLDEGAIIRQYDEQFMSSVAPLFRNAGLLGFITMQRDVGAHPALRACVRCVMLFPGAGEFVKHLGFEIPETLELSRPGRLVYRFANEFRVWDGTGEAPYELITPGSVSNPIPERI